MLLKDQPEDLVWRALANPARRQILDHLRIKPFATGELASLFLQVSRFAIMQHLKILIAAELVIKKKAGRKSQLFLNPVPIQQIHRRWVSQYQEQWSNGLLDLKENTEGRV